MPKARTNARAVDTPMVDTTGSTYAEAQQALEASLAQLQRDDLPLEDLPGVYGRAMAWEARCREILSDVSQQIQRLDPETLELMPWSEPQP
jgi:exodeoxyribonuclease VII small subunit